MSSMTSDSNTSVEWIYDVYREVEEEDMTTKLIQFISIAAPNAVFSVAKSRRRRRKKILKFVHKELKTLFLNSLDIFAPSKPGPVPNQRPPVPVVDWSKVNNRSLGNLPTPQMFPMHGCSDDPNIYAQRSWISFASNVDKIHNLVNHLFVNPNLKSYCFEKFCKFNICYICKLFEFESLKAY